MRSHYVVLLCLPLFFIGCSRSSAPTQMQLDSSVNGGVITALPNETFSLRLDLNFDAGYQWNYQISDSTVVAKDAQPTFQPPKTGVGGVTVETFYFRVLREGQCSMTFAELRGWEQGVPPISTVNFIVVAIP